jgi:hypothetical protein
MEAETRGAADPIVLLAAILAGGMAVVYVWLIRLQGNQPVPWFLIALCSGALLAAYGTFRRAPCRRTALVAAAAALMVLGLLAILTIGLPILASGVLVVASLLRPARRAAL